jgi:hypothetical protein
MRGEVTLRRFAALLTFLVALGISITGCGGSSNTSTVPYTMTISPTSFSLNYGDTVQLSPIVRNYAGDTLNGQTVLYTSTRPTIADVANGSNYAGAICAGVWDSETNPVVCHPASIAGAVTVTASIGNINTPVTVFVHPPIGSIAVTATSATINGAASALPITVANCLSGARTTPDNALFTATVCSSTGPPSGNCPNGEEITGWVGPLNWTVNPGTVGTKDTSGYTCANYTQSCFSGSGTGALSSPLCNTCQLTAAVPGQAFVTASAGNVTSSPTTEATITTCPITSISLTQLASGSASSSSVAAGGAVSLTATATDSSGTTFQSLPSSIAYASSQPAVAAASASLIGGVAGATTLVADCLPPNCNAGLSPVYSNPYGLTVTASGGDAAVVYASSSHTTGTYLVPISALNVVGTAITVSTTTTPNSMMLAPTGDYVVFGSTSGGVLIYNISASTSTNTGFNGKVLAISPDGSTLVVYDPNASPTAYIYSLSSSSLLASFPMQSTNSAHAVFSPDSSTAYVAGTTIADSSKNIQADSSKNVLYVWTSGTSPSKTKSAVSTVQLLNDIDIFPQGSFVFTAGGSNLVSALATCNSTDATPGSASNPGTPLNPAALPTILRVLPNGSLTTESTNPKTGIVSVVSSGAEVLAVNSPFIDDITVTAANSTSPGVNTNPCTPPALTETVDNAFNFSTLKAENGAGFTASQMLVTSDASKAFILDDSQSVVLLYTVATHSGSTIQIANNVTPVSGAATLDSQYLWFGASDGQVHRIDMTANGGAGGDVLQLSLSSASAPPNFKPDFIAVTP